MIQKVIILEWKNPTSALEKSCLGYTEKDKNIIRVFLRNNTTRQLEVFFHEMTHVFFRCYRRNKQFIKGEEEVLADRVGRVVKEVLGKD